MGNIRVDFNNMMKDIVGKEGFTKEALDKNISLAKNAFKNVKQNKGKGWMEWCNLPFNQNEICNDIITYANKARKQFKNFVVLGIGGSALGPTAVFTALKHFRYNDLDSKKRNGPKFFVEDNVDPTRMNALLDVIDPKETLFNVITKSGSTSETMSQYLIIIDILKKALKDKAKTHIVATTDENKGNLIKIAKQEGYKTFYVGPGVGGRFSELSPVGLLPAAMLGIDIKKLLKGAADMDKLCMNPNVYKNPALLTAYLMVLSYKKGKNISVMMPYSDALRYMADWYAQLWGESLGKAVDLNGKKVNVGQTPVKSLGVTDQHSQVQLYTEGPHDKVITFIGVEKFNSDVKIPSLYKDIPDVNFLGGHTLAELINTERVATEYAVTKAGQPNYTILLDKIDENTIGQLIALFEYETAFAGAMLNVDTFNQPGVEEGKNATYALFNRKGYEKKRDELNKRPKKNNKYIIG